MDDMAVEKRWFVIALIGGEVGAALGLLLFGGILFVPMLCALLGSFAAPAAVYAHRRWLTPPREQLTSG